MREHFNKPLIMTPENERDFQNSASCYICGRKYKNGDENKPVRDHCHITGTYTTLRQIYQLLLVILKNTCLLA